MDASRWGARERATRAIERLTGGRSLLFDARGGSMYLSKALRSKCTYFRAEGASRCPALGMPALGGDVPQGLQLSAFGLPSCVLCKKGSSTVWLYVCTVHRTLCVYVIRHKYV